MVQARRVDESQEVRALVSRWTELAVIDGLLVWFRQRKSQVVLCHRLRQTMFRHMHASPLSAGHMGRDRTLREKASWPGYRSDVYEWMRHCIACQLANHGPGPSKMPLVQERAGAPFERVALDLIGPLPPSRRGKVYLLVMQDCYTKWVETAPLPNKSAPVVTEAFANTWVVRYGSPRVLHQDNDCEFTAEVFVELCKLLGIARTTTTPYYPQSNGQVVRVNQTLQNLAKAMQPTPSASTSREDQRTRELGPKMLRDQKRGQVIIWSGVQCPCAASKTGDTN
jgi:transposase InsO family protein